MLRRPQQILVLGQGPEASGLTAALANLPGIKSVRQQGRYTVGEPLPPADLCIELLGGISVAHAAATQALAQGMGLIIGSPALAAMHGALLHGAARGQGAFFSVAAHSCGLLPQQLQAAQATKVVLIPASTPQQALRRMAERGETLQTAMHQLAERGAAYDTEGKETHARAHALFGAWQGQWLNPAQTQRNSMQALEPWHLTLANRLGLQLAYGTELTARGLRTGLIALPPETPLPLPGTECLLANTPYGPQSFTFGTEGSLTTAALGAAQRALNGPMLHAQTPLTLAAQPLSSGQVLVLGNASQRSAALAAGPKLAEDHAQQGWGAILQPLTTLPEGLLSIPLPYPLPRATTPHLRLVG